jgi:hypothetical protein
LLEEEAIPFEVIDLKNNDKNIQTDLIIMDFAKAFDKVPHKRLISKLKFYGISDQITIWITLYHQATVSLK